MIKVGDIVATRSSKEVIVFEVSEIKDGYIYAVAGSCMTVTKEGVSFGNLERPVMVGFCAEPLLTELFMYNRSRGV